MLGSAAAFLLAGTARATPAVWPESAMVKIRPKTSDSGESAVDLYGARNEFVSFQVAVNGGEAGASGVSAKLSAFTGTAGALEADTTVYRETYLNIVYPSTPDVSPGLWPDGLIPDVDEIDHQKRNAFPFDVPADQSRGIWIDLLIPIGATPGDYQGTVTVTADGGFSASIPVTVHVLPATLPSTNVIATAFQIYAPNVCMAHYGNRDCGGPAQMQALLNKYQRLALDHRLSLDNLVSVPSGSDWSAYDAEVGPMMNGTMDTRLVGAKETALKYQGPVSASSYAAFEAHMKAKGWLSRAFDYTGDEPPYGNSYSEIHQRAAIVRQGAPDLSTLVTTSIQNAENNGILGDIDIMVPIINQIDGPSGTYEGDQRSAYSGFLSQPHKQMWLYQSCMSHGCAYGSNEPGNVDGQGWPDYVVDTSAARNRAMQWVDWVEGATGELYFETAMALPSAWTNQFQFSGNGDGTLFYPGTPSRIGGTTQVPLPSIRLKLLRLGMQDYAWLKMVADSGDPEFARQVARSVVPAAYSISDDGSVILAARRKLEQRWLELNPSAEPPPTDTGTPPGQTTPSAPDGGAPPTKPPAKAPSIGVSGPVATAAGCESTGAAAGSGLALLAVCGLLAAARRKRSA